jgi:tetratricopeptide (TPR) repeat protein
MEDELKTVDGTPVPVAVSEASEAEAEMQPERRQSRLIAGITAAAILVFPFGYLIYAGSHGKKVMANNPAVAAPATNIAAQEALVRQSPTEINLINLSLAYINSGASVRAIPVLQAVVARDKNSAVAWNDLCVAQTLQGGYAEAIDACNQALTINPTFQLARNNLRWASGERQKTLAVIARADKSETVHDADFYMAQGLNDIHVGDYDQSIVAWQHALQLSPKSALATNNIGTAYMMKKHPEIAIGWFEKAIVLDPSLQIAKNNLAWAQGELRK